ncbi:putative Tetratricopeptide repeat protein [Tripterygium wilfordii]|uniref:Putative Tetratricopeptide repeat protein n=1 Tax=Tripterygium wilfordii TaxID=458696 RepID=A0A7J7CV63_TRIWF|nr:inactive TPR repeat-containing thioredoxin TTL3-like [Tripterygium wilfordii]KAF5737980.1 putative Tetratricopeptide repeat protein [Tripterygium wilfordii]
MGDTSPDRKSGCGLLNAVFGRRSFWPRRSTSTGSLPTASNGTLVKTPSTPNSKRRRGGSDEAAFLDPSMNVQEAHQKPITRAPNHPKIPPAVYQQQQLPNNVRRNLDHEPNRIAPSQGYVNQGRRVPKEAIGISGELESMIADHQKSKGRNGLVRASSSNVMLMGNLGNLQQPGGGNTNSYNILDHLPKTAREETTMPNGRYPNSVMGNVVKKTNEAEKPPKEEQPAAGSLCRAISTRMDPEQLKIMGNEDYKNGNFAEALALYDAAISIDPNKASYRSNKSAALTALGRILEAVFECREAIRIDPRYHRAHHRLANLYLRLGEAEKAIYHYKHAGPEADHVDISKAKTLQAHLNRCTEARRLRDWNTLIKETANTMSAGADSAPQIYALQAEALLKLHRHQEADDALTKGPKFEVDACTKFFGPISNANLLVVRAQVELAAGRFDDALASAQRAARLDSNNKEVNMVIRRARAVGAARSNGNELFKASKFNEACGAYGEGLEHDPYNSVLLCNRAACRSKLGHYEKAVADCSAALNVRPNYSKARLRRADCNAKLGRWEASIQDYEVLQKETPEDEEISQGLEQAQAQLKKRRGE